MNMQYKTVNSQLRLNIILIIAIIISTFFLSIGYEAINPIALDIKSIASASAQNGVFITHVELVDSKNIDNSNTKIINMYQSMLQTNVVLSNSTVDTYAKYKITMYNSTKDNYCFYATNNEGLYSNYDIGYELDDLEYGTGINPGSYRTFYITFKYNTDYVPQKNDLDSYIEFIFKKAYSVTYENITNNNYPNYAITEETFSVSFGTLDAPIEVKMGGTPLNQGDYTYSNYTLTIPSVTGNIHIRKLKKYTLKNLVINGSFEKGLNNWNIVGNKESWLYTKIFHFGSAAYYRIPSSNGWNYLTQSIYWKNGHKYYYFAYTICNTNQDFVSDITNRGGSIKITSVPYEYRKGSALYTSNFTGNNNISINFAKITDNVIVDGIGVIDLTEAFGAGNEPDLAWCDANINYFDGTATVYK